MNRNDELIPYADLVGSPEEKRLRAMVRTILKHHQILNGVLEADLVSMMLGAISKAEAQS